MTNCISVACPPVPPFCSFVSVAAEARCVEINLIRRFFPLLRFFLPLPLFRCGSTLSSFFSKREETLASLFSFQSKRDVFPLTMVKISVKKQIRSMEVRTWSARQGCTICSHVTDRSTLFIRFGGSAGEIDFSV